MKTHTEHINQQKGNPAFNLSPENGHTNGSVPHGDECFPEVVIDTSPQVIPNLEADYKVNHLEEREPKYHAIYDDELKEVVPVEHEVQEQYPQTAINFERSVLWESAPGREQASGAEERPAREGKVWGLTRKRIFIVLAAFLVIIAAAVGGGVGGRMASSKSNSPAPITTRSESSSSPSTSTPPTSITSQAFTSSASTTTSVSSTATFLNNQTAKVNTFAFQGFSETGYLGNATAVVGDEGGTNFTFNISSYVWLPNTTSCCLSFCENATKEGLIGWWCDPRYQKDSSASFPRIFVWCGLERMDENAKCV
ncbi:uncharacterized protein A1O9_03925 [Exophiala aquamarina CBS 119918]|uniref:Uncharacterized protein n=1 Tax=Exophiala aquamarina CBS 119918 TaxID=1182545 RepID=A0A072PH48_9EURO|nr:uncharacterized protein A1O9_03925 [Exophiala aquamarina CBS 119918]KEF59082.1 hypothetical protein A1O9_03925 [Exophiala aquamarina CBS 119918]